MEKPKFKFHNIRNLNREKVFWTMIDKKESWECWPFKGCILQSGYGSFWFRGGPVRAHRFAYVSFHQRNIPDGLQVLHRCDNPKCCNPYHLFLGTPSDNMMDMVAKGRGRNGKEKLIYKIKET